MIDVREEEDILAFTNPEHMNLDELREFIQRSTGTQHRLAPPSRPAPQPPSTPPPLPSRRPRSKLYQNIDVVLHQPLQPIHVQCDFCPANVQTPDGLLIPVAKPSAVTSASSLYFLSTTGNTSTSDSSSATMIVRKSPSAYSPACNFYKPLNILANFDGSFNHQVEKSYQHEFQTRTINSLSPIMTSSRSDLNVNMVASPTLLQSSLSPPIHFYSISKRARSSPFASKRLSLDLVSPNKKYFNNNNYFQAKTRRRSISSLNEYGDEMVDSSSLAHLLPPSPFKNNTFNNISILPPPPIISNLTRNRNETRKTTKKVSFMIRKFEEEEVEFESPLSVHSFRQIIFANHDYFSSKNRHIESSTSSSSSFIPSSSASSCSSSSSSSGYKSNQSTSICVKYVENESPNELNCFVEKSRERLDRLKMRRRMLASKSHEKYSSINLDSSIIKKVSAKLFQKLLSSKSSSILPIIGERFSAPVTDQC